MEGMVVICTGPAPSTVELRANLARSVGTRRAWRSNETSTPFFGAKL